jgi:hypothetical protein
MLARVQFPVRHSCLVRVVAAPGPNLPNSGSEKDYNRFVVDKYYLGVPSPEKFRANVRGDVRRSPGYICATRWRGQAVGTRQSTRTPCRAQTDASILHASARYTEVLLLFYLPALSNTMKFSQEYIVRLILQKQPKGLSFATSNFKPALSRNRSFPHRGFQVRTGCLKRFEEISTI